MKQKVHILFLLLSTVVFAQQKRVTTSIDSTKVKIGAQINLTLQTKVDTLSKVAFPEGKLFGRLEVLESYPTDTIKENNKYQLIKKYGLTQFDSGKYCIPSLEVIINGKVYPTDSILVKFIPVEVDTLKQHMYDIKDISTVPNDYSYWWVILLIVIGVAGLGYLIYYIVKRNKNTVEEETVYASPIEKATAHLKSLEKKNLVERGEVKEYYSELTTIARTYIEEAIEIPAMESTTDELIAAFKIAIVKKKLSLTDDTIKNLEKVLKQADLVKFAKSKPLEFEIADDKIKIEKTIYKIHHSIPEATEEDDLIDNEAIKDKVLKREKERKRNIIILSSLGVLSLSFGIIVAVKGFDFLKENIIGHPTKELLEGDWVLSEYGNPAIVIETPKVLKRMNVSKMMEKESGELANMQMFGYGSMMDDYYIAIMTTNFKKEINVDLNQAFEGSLRLMEANGAQNILVKQDEFSTPEGINGLKAYGTMSILDKLTKKSRKAYYEAIYFAQEGGLQQIVVMHDEGDEVANQITERIMNSVELAKLKQ
jgi:hypothetical protein